MITRHSTRNALTIIELLVVLLILATLAGIVVAIVPNIADDSRMQVTKTNMTWLQNVMLGAFRADMAEEILGPYRYQSLAIARPLVLPRPGYYALNNSVGSVGPRPNKPQLRYLFVNPGPYVAPGIPETTTPSYDPSTGHGWRGPYILPGIGKYPEPTAGNFTRDYGEKDDPTILDGWGRPIVIVEVGTIGAELRSAGPDGVLMTSDDMILALY